MTPSTSYRLLLRNRDYSLLWGAQLVSFFGDRLHQIALLFLVGSLTGNALSSIGLVFVTIGLPSLLFGPFAGALVDRWDRRKVMMASDVARCGLVLCIPFVADLGVWWVYAATFLITTAGLFFQPAQQATIPAVVSEEQLMAANSLYRVTDAAMDILGYPIAGAMVAGLAGYMAGDTGIHLALYVDAATYAISALLIYRMTHGRAFAERAEEAAEGLIRSVVGGVRYLRSHGVLMANTVIATLAALVLASTFTLSYGYATEVTATGAFGYAVMEAGLGVGVALGALAVGKWGGTFRKGRMILLGVVVMGASMGSLALFANLWLAVAMLLVAGVGNMMLAIPSVTLVQQITTEAFLGRVLSLRFLLQDMAIIFSSLLAGIGAELVGVRPMWGLVGGSLMVLALLSAFVPSARDVA